MTRGREERHFHFHFTATMLKKWFVLWLAIYKLNLAHYNMTANPSPYVKLLQAKSAVIESAQLKHVNLLPSESCANHE